ncbi:hypothetical protein EON78_06945 [bacterium]|nr:MAG: hypothetical protein EON78_06945 [bacterium]
MNLALPEEALKLLMNIKEADKPKKIQVSSNHADLLNNKEIPDEAMSLLMNIKEADRIIEKNISDKKDAEQIEIISKMSFNPDTGFSIDPAMLAKLNLMNAAAAETPKLEEQPVFTRIDNPPAISITETNNYTPDEKTSIVRSFNINEEGVFLGIILGSTTKSQAIEILTKFSSYKYDMETAESILSYDDLSITVYHDDENIVNQLEFGKSFRGNTSKGLKIGDTVETATFLYGPPTMKSPKGAFWKNLKVFCTDGYITSIKIQK